MQGTLYVYYPSVKLTDPLTESSNQESDPASSSSDLQSTKGSIFNLNNGIPTSPFTPNNWVRAYTTLLKNGMIEITCVETGTLLFKSNIRTRFLCGIRMMEYSAFHLNNVIFIGEYPQTDPSSSSNYVYEDQGSHSIAKTRHRKLKKHHKSFSQGHLLLIKHSHQSACKTDGAVYIKPDSHEDCRNWLLALKRSSRLQVYAPSSGDPEKSFRFSRTLSLRILEAKVDSLHSSNSSDHPAFPYSEVYVEICFGNRVWARTSISRPTKSPFWREDFTFTDIDTPTVPDVYFNLRRRIPPEDPLNDPLLGVIKLSHDDLVSNGNLETWYQFETLHNNQKDDSSLCLKVRFEQIQIASAIHYERVQDELSLISDESLALLTIAEEILSRRDISPMSDICLNIALASPSDAPAIKWISALISQDILKTRIYVVGKQGIDCFNDFCTLEQQEFKRNLLNSMFRGNTILTKSLEKYMRTVGQSQLEKIIGSFVKSVVKESPDLEIDPGKIKLLHKENMTSDETHAAKEAAVKVNQARLLEYTARLWCLIKNGENELPLSLKLIFRHLRSELTSKLQLSEISVHNSIAGFLFLRFLCPGLLNPKLFGFICAQEASKVQRPLTLVAKILMAFANRNRFGMKEPYMIPMNKFFDEHAEELAEYYKNVTLYYRSDAEVYALQAVDLPGVLPKRNNSLRDSNLPLSEHFDNPYLLDEHLTFARFFEFWKNVIKPNKTEIFDKIHSFIIQQEELIKHGDTLNCSSVTEFSEACKTSELTSRADNIFEKVKNELNRLFEACQECSDKVDSIVSELTDEPEEFDRLSISAYMRHMTLTRNVGTGSLRLIPGIRAHSDWDHFQEAEGPTPCDSPRRRSSDQSFLSCSSIRELTVNEEVDVEDVRPSQSRSTSSISHRHSSSGQLDDISIEVASEKISLGDCQPGHLLFAPTHVLQTTLDESSAGTSKSLISDSASNTMGTHNSLLESQRSTTSFNAGLPSNTASSSNIDLQDLQSSEMVSPSLSGAKRLPKWFKTRPSNS